MLTGKITIATVAQKAWNLAQKMNPIGLVIGLLAAAGTALYMYSKKMSAAEKAQKELNNTMLEAKKSIVDQKVEMELLMKTAKDETRSIEDRRAAIKKLNEISPEYMGNITLETINTNAATKATELYIEALEKKARVQAAQEKLIDIEKQLLDLREQGIGADTSGWQNFLTTMEASLTGTNAVVITAAKIASNWKEKEDELLKVKENLLGVIQDTVVAQDELNKKIIDPVAKPTGKSTTSSTATSTESPYKKQLEEAMYWANEEAKLMANNAAEANKFREDDLKAIEDKYKREKTLAETKYNEELLALGTDEEAKKALKVKFDADELQRNLTHLNALRAQMAQSLEGINLEESLLSNPEYANLVDKIAELDLIISALKLKIQGEEGEPKSDIFGMTPEEWDSMMGKVQMAIQVASQINNTINAIYSHQNKLEQESLRVFEQSQADKRKNLEQRLKSGSISQKDYNAQIEAMDTALDEKKRILQNKEAKRAHKAALFTAIINTAGAIVSGLMTQPFMPLGIAMGALSAVLGGIQIGLIASEPGPTYAQGNRQQVIGAQDGKNYNAKVADKNHKSGLFSEPTYVPGFGLFGETRDPELVFNPRDTQAIINSPALIDAINMTLGGARQYAQGNSREIIRENNTVTTASDPKQIDAMNRFADVAERMMNEGIQANLLADEDYIRTHKKKVTEYDSFKQRIGN